ncbi:hypothetical protein [Rhodopseudomonas palustris]|uniref:hypothetical protein n=1 Tax=Rhodopseudomonas palustris TaxID=1076 RepID=UPI001F43BEBF|nr:hypothetical protein [Rhodopseudomonas palustris]
MRNSGSRGDSIRSIASISQNDENIGATSRSRSAGASAASAASPVEVVVELLSGLLRQLPLLLHAESAELIEGRDQGLRDFAFERQDAAADLHLRPDLNDAGGDPIPALQSLGRAPLADQNRLAAADQIARAERSVTDDVAHLVETHRRVAQRRDIGADRRRFLPAAALEIVVDNVAAVFEIPGEEILECARPYGAREQILADDRHRVVQIDTGFLAGGHGVAGENDFEPIAPRIAQRMLDQSPEHMLVGHVSTRITQVASRRVSTRRTPV